MQKICILTTVHTVFDTRIFHKQAISLEKNGYKVILIAQHTKNEVVNNVTIKRLPLTKNRFYRMFFLNWLCFFYALKEKADLYHFHDPELTITAFFLKVLTGKKIIYDVHEDYSEAIKTKLWIPAFIRNIIIFFYKVQEKLLTCCYDSIITVTDTIEQKYPANKIIQIRNYPLIDFIPQNTKKNYKKKDNYTLIYAGSISRIRGILEIIKALDLVKHTVKLKLLGSFESKELEKEASLLPGYRKVDFMGWVDRKTVHIEMQAADIGLICLHPVERYKVAIPVKLFEYMSIGIPVIASDFPFWKQFIEEENCGLMINPLVPQDIALAIDYLIDNPELCCKMGTNGIKAVSNKFNWLIEEKKLLALYKKLLEN